MMHYRLEANLGLRGFVHLATGVPQDPSDIYALKGVKPGSRRVIADWFRNKILDTGRNRMGTSSDWLNYAQVGNGSTPPTAADTALEQYVAGTGTIIATQTGAQTSAPYFGWKRITYRFPVGAATGNLQEGGVGWASSSSLYSRALIVDENGDPTTATVLANEFLDLTYEIRYYPPLSDVLGVLTLDGVAYDTTIRASEVTSTEIWGEQIGNVVEAIHIPATIHLWMGYDGTLGSIIQAPNGATAGFFGTVTNNAYVNNSYKRHFVMAGTASAFVFDPVGTRSIRLCTRAGHYQMQFDAQVGGGPLLKTLGHSLNLEFDISWSEKV